MGPGIIGIGGVSKGANVSFTSHHRADSQLSIHPVSAPGPVTPLLPTSPIHPFLPSGPVPQPTSGLCNLNLSAVSHTLERTAGDCTVPLAMYVGNVICCPQFESMLWILEGEYSHISGSLVLNNTEAVHCLAEMMGFLIDNGANNTITELCNVQPRNLTGGACPVTRVEEFEQVVNTSKLLAECSSVDPLKECCKSVCQPVITDAAVRLASQASSSRDGNSLGTLNLQQVLDDCQGVVHAWLARQLGPEISNSAFRILFSCKVNQVCPLAFDDVSSVAKSCSGLSPSATSCCSSLYAYISKIQQQMLITNVQALDCVTLFGSMLKRRGVNANLYNLCKVDLKDFSLQAFGDQGCLLRAIPTDIIFDNSSGISFTCDLNDNIPAPWPASSSLSTFPLCATRETLPALPVLDTSGSSRRLVLELFILFMVLFHCITFQSI